MESVNENSYFIDPEDWQKFEKYLSETNRFILTDYWENFIATIVKTSLKRIGDLKKGTRLLRARIGIKWIESEDGTEQPYPLKPEIKTICVYLLKSFLPCVT